MPTLYGHVLVKTNVKLARHNWHRHEMCTIGPGCCILLYEMVFIDLKNGTCIYHKMLGRRSAMRC